MYEVLTYVWDLLRFGEACLIWIVCKTVDDWKPCMIDRSSCNELFSFILIIIIYDTDRDFKHLTKLCPLGNAFHWMKCNPKIRYNKNLILGFENQYRDISVSGKPGSKFVFPEINGKSINL